MCVFTSGRTTRAAALGITCPHTTPFFCFFLFFFRWQNDKSGGTSNEVPTHNKETHYDFAGSVADGKLEARAVPEADFWQNQPGTNGKKTKHRKVLQSARYSDFL